jgi:hypothetical protein
MQQLSSAFVELGAEPLHGGLDTLAAFPEVDPEVPFGGDASRHALQSERFGAQTGT